MKPAGNVTHQPYQTLIGKREKDAMTCGVCCRAADGLGYADHRAPIMRICEECAPHAQEVYRMSQKSLSVYEENALADAAKAIAQEQVEAILTALYDAGVTDLSTMTAEQMESAVAAMFAAGTLTDFARRTLLAFGTSIRGQIESGRGPF